MNRLRYVAAVALMFASAVHPKWWRGYPQTPTGGRRLCPPVAGGPSA